MSTPEARSNFIRASTVCGVGSKISISLLCVLVSNCSLLFLSICGDLNTVKTSFYVGKGIGPLTWAPVLLAVLTISIVDKSRILLSYALKWILIFCLSINLCQLFCYFILNILRNFIVMIKKHWIRRSPLRHWSKIIYITKHIC